MKQMKQAWRIVALALLLTALVARNVAAQDGQCQNDDQSKKVATEISKTVESKPLVIYSKSYCPYCARVKRLLVEEMKLPAAVFELDQIEDGALIQTSLQSVTGRRTVPQVFIGGKFVGGSDDVMAANEAGTLQQWLKDAGVSATA